MLRMTHYLLKLAVVLRFCCEGYDGYEQPPKHSAEFSPTDQIEVYYGEYLLASWILSHSPWNAYHSGVGFLNNNTGEKVLVDYTPRNTSTVTHLIFPQIRLKSDKFWTWLTGDVALKWNNQALTTYQEYWPEHYTSFTKIGTINGSIFNRYMDWLKTDFDPTHVTFEPVEVVVPHKSGAPGVPSRMCHDFVTDSLWVLYDMGARFAPEDAIFRDHIIFYAESFEEIDYKNSGEAKRDVLRYFRVFELHLSRVKEQFTYVRDMLVVAWKMGIPPVLYSDRKYIRVNIMEPFLNYCYLPLAIPPAKMNLLADTKLCALPMGANTSNTSLAVPGKNADTIMGHLIAAEARLDRQMPKKCFIVTAVLLFLGSFRKYSSVVH